MEAILDKLLDSFWLKPKSVIIFWVLAIVASLGYIPSTVEELSWKAYVFPSLFFVISCGYSIGTWCHCRLPKATDCLSSVLFIIDAESDQLFRDVKNKLVTEFEERSYDSDRNGLTAICVEKEKVAKFNIHQPKSAIDLLIRVNCMCLVSIIYRVDSVTNAEDYSLHIDFGVRHPDIDDIVHNILLYDMQELGHSIKDRRFVKANTIDTMRGTASTLSVMFSYLIGLVMLFAGAPEKAYERFHSLQATWTPSTSDYIDPDFSFVLKYRLYCTCMELISLIQNQFFLDNDPSILIDIEKYNEEANTLFPNTYSYFLNKAYYLVAHDFNSKEARKCVNICRHSKTHQEWHYSDAFIAAFEENPPYIVYGKYMEAFKYDYPLDHIINFIMYMLDWVPEKTTLHLAAGLVYDELGDKIFAQQHYDMFFEKYDDPRLKRILISQKKWNPRSEKTKGIA